MLPYGRVDAVHQQRVARFMEDRERADARRRAAEQEPGGLTELLNALARGLAGIGLGGPGHRGRPARPAH